MAYMDLAPGTEILATLSDDDIPDQVVVVARINGGHSVAAFDTDAEMSLNMTKVYRGDNSEQHAYKGAFDMFDAPAAIFAPVA